MKKTGVSCVVVLLLAVCLFFTLKHTEKKHYVFHVYDLQTAIQFYSVYGVTSIPVKLWKDGVPKVFARNLPAQLKKLELSQRSSFFTSVLLPIILRCNNEIANERAVVERLRAKERAYQRLSWKENASLIKLFKKYDAPLWDYADLLKKLDKLPVSLVLAQGILESGWGTSRFAVQGNNLYGMHYSSRRADKFMVSRSGGVKVAAYDSLYEATRAYMLLLNTGAAYENLREMRREARLSGEVYAGYDAAQTLTRYSERGTAYVASLHSIMNRYRLSRYTHARLDQKSGRADLIFVTAPVEGD
jgi:uncharacterized FlgJ-related protein